MKELFSALCKAQSQIRGAVKDSRNPHFNSMFANLESVVEAIRQPLADNGLCFVQSVCEGHVHTIICHTSGEQMVSTVPFVGNMPDMQKVGAALTYARRQGLCTAFGVPQVDDDFESGLGRGSTTSPKVEVTNSKSTHVTKPSEVNVSTVVTPKTDKISADLAKELGTPAEVTPLYPLFTEGIHNEQVMAIVERLKISGDFLKKHKVEMKKALSENRTDVSLEAAIITFVEGKKS